MSLRRSNKRLRSSLVFVTVLFVLLVGWAVRIQVVHGAEYQDMAERQHVREFAFAPKRGVIYDRNGEELAVSRRMATIGADPFLVADPEATATALAPVLGMDVADLTDRLSGEGRYVMLSRRVEPELGERVLKLKLRGVVVHPEEKRVYPKGALAPQLLGFVGTDNKGLAGLEKQYDDVLRGDAGSRRVVGDPFGRTLGVLFDQAGRGGRSLVLTIDEDIQFAAEQALAEAVERFGALKGSAVVLDPRSGEVLAMANVPYFDTNQFGAEPEENRRNTTVNDQFEPGSTFKMVVTAAALEEGLVTPETPFELGPSITVYDRTVHEAHDDTPAKRVLTVTEILSQSSNVGAVKLGLEVGKERLVKAIKDFGFTRATGIEFPGEASGSMLSPEKWSGSTIANVPIGQGISVTSVQLAAAYGAIANDGVYVQPHLTKDATLHPPRRVVSSNVARQLRQMLLVSVAEGTGTNAQVEGYEVAGKTGTAQKALLKGKGYSKDKFSSSFVGMVPADDPALVILVVIDEPATEYYGSIVAAPVFATIADFSLRRLAIPPSGSR
ncbi:MAG: peptidoglycan D,D-transpeptidase FtsI family protein [Thermoleophilia bacterium]